MRPGTRAPEAGAPAHDGRDQGGADQANDIAVLGSRHRADQPTAPTQDEGENRGGSLAKPARKGASNSSGVVSAGPGTGTRHGVAHQSEPK